MTFRFPAALIAAFSVVLATSTASGAVLEDALAAAGDNAGELRGFVEAAGERHGEFGKVAATFLVEHMPPRDLRSLDRAFLLENLELAIQAREEFPWASELPEDLFLNDVLPYASLDETREPWRREFYERCRHIVKNCTTAGEAAQALNREFFDVIGVHYDTGRKAPNQSPAESRKLGMATCTGLSIILVDACRAVGVPARVAGTALWTNKRGNHTWVEVFDGEAWRFTGADEFNKDGLDRAWFVGDASKAVADDWRHAIWATSWQRTGSRFPMVWNLEDETVPGVNVTARYAGEQGAEPVEEAIVHLRLRETRGGDRIVAEVDLLDAEARVVSTVTTRAGTSDLNDMPSLTLKAGVPYRLRIRRQDGGGERTEALRIEEPGESTRDLVWDELGQGTAGIAAVKDWLALLPEERHLSMPQIALSRKEAAAAARLILAAMRADAEQAGRAIPGDLPRARRPWRKTATWPPAAAGGGAAEGEGGGPAAARFSWLRVPDGAAPDGASARAVVRGQRIEITADEGIERLEIDLSDRLLDLDEPVVVVVNGETAVDATIERRIRPILRSLWRRPDPRTVASAVLEVNP